MAMYYFLATKLSLNEMSQNIEHLEYNWRALYIHECPSWKYYLHSLKVEG
jgi:hypothetical protein